MSRKLSLLASVALFVGVPQFGSAQDAEAPEMQEEVILVTGSILPKDKIDTSISVSVVSADQISDAAPRGTSEIFRALPGIRSESSAGGGNSNIGVRGIPISTGGAKWVQLQEDGLPVTLFGDMDFAPADGFYKADSTLARVESVRGGSASTLTTNGPGAIINMISKTGKQEGGSLSLERGLGYDDFRVDGDYGSKIGERLFLHLGGHYQIGGDYRNIGYDAVRGGQFKVSLLQEFDAGYVRIYAKLIDKRDATYMPQPSAITGNEISGGLPGLSANDESLHSPYLRYYRGVDGTNKVYNGDAADGFYTNVKAIGAEFEYDLGEGLTISNKARYAAVKGNFEAPFGHDLKLASDYATSLGGALTYFNGPRANTPVPNAALVTEVSHFSTELEDMSNFANDLRLTKSFDFGGSSLALTGGYFLMTQKFKQDWHWQRWLVSTENDAALISVAGVTDQGVLGYNQGFGWDGNNRNYDLDYKAEAPYLNASFDVGALSLEGGVRFDKLTVDGMVTEAAGGPLDVDGDGVIDPPEANVSLNNGVPRLNNFSVDHTSYTFGANYKLADSFAVFARYSNGAAFNGERQSLSGSVNLSSGALRPGGDETFVDVVKQMELGVKFRGEFLGGPVDLNATYFDADTQEDQSEITSGSSTTNAFAFSARGLETELLWRVGDLSLNGTVTWTDAETTAFAGAPTAVGKTPRRQADFIWNLNAAYQMGPVEIGGNLNGTTDTFADFENTIIMPGFQTLGLFANWDMTDRLRLSVNANNVTDEIGFTEAEVPGRVFTVAGNRYTMARSIGGRTVSARLRLAF